MTGISIILMGEPTSLLPQANSRDISTMRLRINSQLVVGRLGTTHHIGSPHLGLYRVASAKIVFPAASNAFRRQIAVCPRLQ
jgi:hypothetical protein